MRHTASPGKEELLLGKEMKMKISILVLVFIFVCSKSSPLDEEKLEDGREFVGPKYLDYLLREKKYEEFNRLLQIDIPQLSRPRCANASYHPRYNPHLAHGDILFTPKQKEQAREAIDFTKYPTNKWKNGIVPYCISDDYTRKQKANLRDRIRECNEDFGGCVTLRPCVEGDKHYIYIYGGDGCFSNLGCTGGQQPMSLDPDGCFLDGTVCHEIMHALGFVHEQSRCDRDNYIRILWPNIKEVWQSQFDEVSREDYKSCGPYDCYSLMHYTCYHPDFSANGKPAFEVLDPDCDPDEVGKAVQMSDLDIEKVKNLYCNNNCKPYA